MYNDIAMYIDQQLELGQDWPVVVVDVAQKFNINNRSLIVQIYNDWVNGK